MRRERDCLNCANWRPDPPAGFQHKSWQRWAAFSLWDLYRHLGAGVDWKDGWPGQCLLQPQPVETRSIYVCGQWAVNAAFLRSWEDFADLRMAWDERERLKQELKAAKEQSVERYRRLKQIRAREPGASPRGMRENCIIKPPADGRL